MRTDTKIFHRRVSRAFKRSPKLMMDRVDQSAFRAALELANKARDHAPKDRSQLANSIKPDRLGQADYLIGPHEEHGVYAELGTRGGGTGPPHQPLVDWVRSAGGLNINDEDEAERVAWAVQRKIAREGTPPQPYMEPAAEAMDDRTRLLIQQGMQAGLRAAGL